MSNCNYLEQIIKFNSDKEIIALREKYKEPTFFEIISKQRSETTYSSFLKWMFQSSRTDLNTVSPILLLLDVLVKRGNNQINDEGNNIIDESLKNIIVTRNFKLNNIDVEAEKSVKVLAQECIGRQKATELSDDDLKQIASKCQDRIDLFINCDIEIDNKSMQLQVIIENKIDSAQGGMKKNNHTNVDTYEKASQTDRYYMATARNSEDLKQVYVYLLPESSDYTKDRIKENEHKVNPNFIEIYYQDIVDDIVIPMLSSTTLSARERFFLEELKTELTFPSLEGDNVKNNIASSKENVDIFSRLWENFSQLIISAAIATSESDIYVLDNRYYNEELLYEYLISTCITDYKDELLKGKWLRDEKFNGCKCIQHTSGKYYYSSTPPKKFLNFVEDKQIVIPQKVEIKEDVNLLSAFWENNKRFLLAFMNGLKEDEHQKIDCLTKEASKRTNTKYKVFYRGKCLNDIYLNKAEKGSNNSETAWLIIKAWAEEKQNKSITLVELRNKFNPSNCNAYYSSGRYFSNLFYIFNKNGLYIADGSENFKGKEVLAGGWDFYKPKNIDNDKKFRIQTSDGEVIMLKMWRKDGLKKLKNLVENPDNGYFEKDELSIIDLSSQQSE